MSATSRDMLSAPIQTEILVVRHAEVHNPQAILYGRLPGFRLSENGRDQAAATGRFVSTRPVVAIYSSPLLRARQTASILREYLPGRPVHLNRGLLEVRTSHQGRPYSELPPRFSFYDPVNDPDDESMHDVLERMLTVLRTVLRRHAGKTTVVVSHADPIAILRLGLEEKPLDTLHLRGTVYPERASVTQLMVRPDGPIQLSYFDIARSAGLPSAA